MLEDAKGTRKRIALTDESAVKTRTPKSGQVMLWDREKDRVPGFGLRILANGSRTPGARSYVLRIRAVIDGQPKQMLRTVGKLSDFKTVDEARERAREMRNVAVKQERDPKKVRPIGGTVETVDTAFARWLAEQENEGSIKATTAKEYGRLWKPKQTTGAASALTGKSVKSITLSDIRELHADLKKRSLFVANRTLRMLSGFFRWCEEQDLREEYSNPCLRVKPAKEAYRKDSVGRSLTTEECTRLGKSFEKARTVGLPLLRRDGPNATKGQADQERPLTPANTVALDALIFLTLTGWREREVLDLKWNDVTLSTSSALIPTKNGKSLRPLSAYAKAVLMRRKAEQSAAKLAATEAAKLAPTRKARRAAAKKIEEWKEPTYAFQNMQTGKAFKEVRPLWEAVKRDAGISVMQDGETPHRFRLHDLRHSFATRARECQVSPDILSHLLGHRIGGITAKYGDAVQSHILAAAETVTGAIGKLIGEPVPDDDSAMSSPSASA